MTAKGKQWVLQTLLLDEVREHDGFQLRAKGIERRHASKLFRELQAGKTLPPLKVAHVGKAYYLVDGFHRLDAHRHFKSREVACEVARMSLEEARAEAEGANTKHGLNLNREDKQRIWGAYIARSGHLDDDGALKSTRVIEADIDGLYSRETIRKRLKAMGLELNEGADFKAWELEAQPSEEELAMERAEEAAAALHQFGAVFPQLDLEDQRRLLEDARRLVDALGRGESGRAELNAVADPLDI